MDADVLNVPMLLVDPYGKFVPGPVRGLPQYVTKSGLVEGDTANPVKVSPGGGVVRVEAHVDRWVGRIGFGRHILGKTRGCGLRREDAHAQCRRG